MVGHPPGARSLVYPPNYASISLCLPVAMCIVVNHVLVHETFVAKAGAFCDPIGGSCEGVS
eukprot:357121-Chlamydomonas_euryale.AAC.6